MPATPQSSPPPDLILQVMSNRLLLITQDLTDLCEDVTDLKQTVTVFQQDFPHKFEAIDTLIDVLG